MKFIHTSDWHLGKLFYEVSLIEDQKFFLQQLLDELCKEQKAGSGYDAVIVSGDIYDRPLPPPEAVSLLNWFLTVFVSEFPQIHLFLSAGNHDSAARLSFAKEILESKNIHIATDVSRMEEGVVLGKENPCAVYNLPFLLPGSLRNEDNSPVKSQNELIKKAALSIKTAHSKKYDNMDSVIAAHIFALNSTPSDSERSWIGASEQVDAEHFKGFTYAALGHIHKKQKISSNSMYSGSPIAYTFGENDAKYFLKVETKGNQFVVEEIPVKPLRNIVRIENDFESVLAMDSQQYKNSFVEVICTDETIYQHPLETLRQKFPYILSFRRKTASYHGKSDSGGVRKFFEKNEKRQDYEELFEEFMKSVYGSDSEELKTSLYEREKKLFKELSSMQEKNQ